MSDDVKVRIGTPDDLDQIMQLALQMHEEIGMVDINPQRILSEIYPSLHLDGGIMGVIGSPDAIEGGILLRISKLFYSDNDILEEKGVFIHPDFRSAKGGRAKKLCEFAKKTSDRMGMPLLIGIQNDVRTKGKLRLYERQFGEPIGAFFKYEPNTTAAVG